MRTLKNIMLTVFFAALLGFNLESLSAKTAATATGINDLRVEYLKNPVGIDVTQPRFSWKMQSDERGAAQTAYEISVSTDPTGEAIVWNSGQIASGKSVHIPYGGPALSPATRYYWKVNIWNQDSEKLSSSETAYFETGLMDSGWSGAKWLKTTTKPQGEVDAEDLAKFSIEMKFIIDNATASPVFSAKDNRSFFMWQINIDTPGRILFRPHVWRNGNPALLAEIDITDIVHIERGTEHTIRMDVNGDVVTTYIDDKAIDIRTNPDGEDYVLGLLGFRSAHIDNSNSSEAAYYDDIKVTSLRNDVSVTLFEEDFSNAENNPFFDSQVIDGKLYVGQDRIAWQKSLRDNITKYSVEMDFEIADVSAGPIFGAKDKGDNFFMWQININNVPGRTLLRPHSWQNGNPACHANIDITDLINVQPGQIYHLRIAIDGDKASTYINTILVDENRTNPQGGNYGYGAVGIGFRADRNEQYVAEKAYYDNIIVQTEIDGQEENFLTETFSDPENYSFTFGRVENGRLYVEGVTTNEPHHLSWQQDRASDDRHFTVEADMTLINGSASIIFSAKNTNSFYMWSVNTHDNAEQPLIRRHFNNGSWAFSDVLIGQYFSKDDLLNHEHHLKIDVRGSRIQTFIDGVPVDTYTDDHNQLVPRGIGFRAFKDQTMDEIVEWDNILLTDYPDGEPVIVFTEDFESGNNPFDNGEIVLVEGNYKYRIFSKNDETRAFDDSMYGIPLFRTEFGLEKEIRSARIYTSGLGVYDVFINGQRVGTPTGNSEVVYDEFKPGWTDYKKTVFYSTYDVKDLLQQGANAIGASVSSGWWNGAISYSHYGSPSLGFLSKLVVEYTDGSSEIVVTSPETWRTSTNGPVRNGDIYNGESYDARKESAWSSPGFNDSDWFQCALNTDFSGEIKAFTGTTVQVRPELQRTPVKITKYEGVTATGTTYGEINVIDTYETPSVIQLNKGQTAVYDLGQNMVGWIKFKVKGTAGSKITIRFAEMLNDNGAASRGNDGPGGSLYRVALRGAKATLQYTLKGNTDGEEFHPSTSFSGFRYCDINTTSPVEIESLVGEVVGTAAEEGSSFVTSHADVNQLYRNIQWGQRGNFLSIPTDCPQRDERLGWTGDIQIFGQTAVYNADLAGFFHKWLGDLRDGQRADGAYPVVAPTSWPPEYGSSAWADAGVVIPWVVYQMYDDKGILEENYEAMERYMGFLTTPLGGADRSGYGDWLAFEATDPSYINICYYAYVASLMEKISNALSTSENDVYAQKAASYQTLFQNIKSNFNTQYVNANGLLKQNTQAAYLLALKFGLLDESNRQKGIDRLKQLIENNGNKLNTGFVGTGILNQTLSEVGLTDIAYNLLLQRNNPSWLYSVDQGATTIWERWNSYTKETGFGDVSMNSFNHYAYGAVGEWMYRYMGGINADENNPGFKHIILTPSPDFRETRPAGQERITKAEASYNSYYGKITSAWEMDEENNVKYDVVIPANTTATLTFPLSGGKVFVNGVILSEAEGLIAVETNEKKAILELQSGSYSFEEKQVTSIKNLSAKKDGLYIYPNPVDNILNISHNEAITNVNLFNSLGKLIYTQPNGDPINMDLMVSGIYFVQISSRETLETAKLIKK